MTIQVLVEVKVIAPFKHVDRSPSNPLWVVGQKVAAPDNMINPNDCSPTFASGTE